MSALELRPGELLDSSTERRLYAVSLLAAMAAAIPWPLAVLLGEELGASGFWLGVLFALPGLSQVLAADATGRFMAVRGKKATLLMTLWAMCAAWGLVALHLSYATLALAQLACGVFFGSATSLAGYIGAHSHADHRATAFGRLLAARGVGLVLGSLAVAALASLASAWSSLSVVVIAGACAAAAWPLRESREPGALRPTAGLLPRVPAGLVLPLIAMALLWVPPAMLSQYVPMHARDAMGVSKQTMAAMFSFLGLTMVLAPLAMKAMSRLAEDWAARGVFLAMALAVVAISAATSLLWLLAAFLAWALLWDTAYPYVKASLSRLVPESRQSEVQAAEQWVVGLVLLVAPPLAGLLYAGAGASAAFGAAAVLSLAGAMAFWFSTQPRKRQAMRPAE